MSEDYEVVTIPVRRLDDGVIEERTVPAWSTSNPEIVVLRPPGAGWSVTHRATGYSIYGPGATCCLAHSREWVDRWGEADWSATTLEEVGERRAELAEAVKEAGPAQWECDLYAELVTLDQAVAAVEVSMGKDAETVRQVLSEALRLRVLDPVINVPEVEW